MRARYAGHTVIGFSGQSNRLRCATRLIHRLFNVAGLRDRLMVGERSPFKYRSEADFYFSVKYYSTIRIRASLYKGTGLYTSIYSSRWTKKKEVNTHI